MLGRVARSRSSASSRVSEPCLLPSSPPICTTLPRASLCRRQVTVRVDCDAGISEKRLVPRESTIRPESSHIVAPAEGAVTVTFRWPSALNSKRVSVAGTFSNWNPVELYNSVEGSDFYRSVRIPIGEHEYKFVADDAWKIYPSDPVTVDAHGNCNNHLSAYPTVRFVWDGDLGGESVYVAGSFNQWKELLPLDYDSDDNLFSIQCYLPPGRYSYMFLVNGEWRVLINEPHKTDPKGRHCNHMTVAPYDAYRIYYATGWDHATVHARLVFPSGQSTVRVTSKVCVRGVFQDWRELTLCDTRSRAGYFGVNWKVATAIAGMFVTDGQHSLSSASLEFYIQNEDGSLDRPYLGDYYRCPVLGGYKLQDGVLKPFSKSVHGPVMLVSDLDGTMVRNEAESDGAMTDFSFYWENNASLYNSVLVYNTGRSLGQFTYLLQQKNGALSLPDVVITAVGTKIFHLSTRGKGRSRASGLDWIEDVNWSVYLDEGWNLEAIREAGHAMIHQLSADCAKWLDYGEEHPHRVAFSVRVDVIDSAKSILQRHLSHHNLEVHLIGSGTGGWRYLDCVPVNGGKLEALEYVREYYNIPLHRCVAAGDSCNDILMLEGKNPAIVVGNAQEELCKWLLSQPQTNRVVFTDAHYARGIIEGLSRLGLY